MSRDWIDLTAASENQEVNAEVCIIGAGAVGLYLASELAREGVDVVLIEAGPASPVDAVDVGFSSLFASSEYPGATKGRYFGMGGTTTRWGGALVPHTKHDIKPGQDMGQVWSTIVERVSMHADSVLCRLGYSKGVDFEEFAKLNLGKTFSMLAQAGIDSQASLLLPFRQKNLLGLLPRASHCRTPPRIFFNAVAKNWVPVGGQSGGSRISRVNAVAKNNNALTVIAKKYILAAGAIESARILMEINESGPSQNISSGFKIGCYLSDHLSIPIADVSPDSRKLAREQFSPRFNGSWMRGFRLLEKSPAETAPRYFAHFIFSKESPGFSFAKKVMQSVQQKCMPDVDITEALTGLDDLTKLAYFRYVKSMLYVPVNQAINLQMDMDQRPIRDNRVELASQRDEYGRKKARIHWSVSGHDIELIKQTAQRILAKWPGLAAGLPDLIPRQIDSLDNKPYDTYHPTGTCRMGEQGFGVVDDELKLFGVDNLWVVNTGVLPSAGTANPTFTTLCLAHHLVHHLRKQ